GSKRTMLCGRRPLDRCHLDQQLGERLDGFALRRGGRSRLTFVTPGLPSLSAQQSRVRELIPRTLFGEPTQAFVVGVGGQITEEREGALLVAHRHRQRTI